MFSALADRNFRLLWLGALGGTMGFFMSVVVQAPRPGLRTLDDAIEG